MSAMHGKMNDAKESRETGAAGVGDNGMAASGAQSSKAEICPSGESGVGVNQKGSLEISKAQESASGDVFQETRRHGSNSQLEEMRNHVEKRTEEEHQKLVSRMIVGVMEEQVVWEEEERCQTFQTDVSRRGKSGRSTGSATRSCKRGVTSQRRRWNVIDSTPFFGLIKRNDREGGGVLCESGTVWEMAATSWHDDVLFDSNECYE